MAVLVANNAEGELASDIDEVQTTITLKTGQGALFPSPSGGDWFPVTLHDLQDNVEIAHCTSRSGDTLTVTRGEEGTTAAAWLADDGAEIRYTQGVHDDILQRLALAENQLQSNGNVAGATTIDPNAGRYASLTLTGDATLSLTDLALSGLAAPVYLQLTQDATGGHSVSFSGTNLLFPGGTSPVISSAADAVDMLEFVWNGSAYLLRNYLGDVK